MSELADTLFSFPYMCCARGVPELGSRPRKLQTFKFPPDCVRLRFSYALKINISRNISKIEALFTKLLFSINRPWNLLFDWFSLLLVLLQQQAAYLAFLRYTGNKWSRQTSPPPLSCYKRPSRLPPTVGGASLTMEDRIQFPKIFLSSIFVPRSL